LLQSSAYKKHIILSTLMITLYPELLGQNDDTWHAQDFCPEQIAQRAKLENVECISHEQTEQYAWADEKAKRNLS
jgi:hypothetical protein